MLHHVIHGLINIIFFKTYSLSNINTNNFLIKFLKEILFLKYKHVIITLIDNICIINVQSLYLLFFPQMISICFA